MVLPKFSTSRLKINPKLVFQHRRHPRSVEHAPQTCSAVAMITLGECTWTKANNIHHGSVVRFTVTAPMASCSAMFNNKPK